MRRVLFVIALTSFLLLSGAKPMKLVRFTIVNKADMEIAVQMDGEEREQFYYLRLPEGDVETPSVQTFTLVPDTYSLQVYYLELWDPVMEPPAPTLPLHRWSLIGIPGWCSWSAASARAIPVRHRCSNLARGKGEVAKLPYS